MSKNFKTKAQACLWSYIYSFDIVPISYQKMHKLSLFVGMSTLPSSYPNPNSSQPQFQPQLSLNLIPSPTLYNPNSNLNPNSP